ncbi:hypothetical protein ACFCYH_22975 [Streptomyces sp. NPDC056400]|uniref:hypothetical protein n=1 Tax=Streptomyces sp. NPDC056400 TaxID=3345808 RepID=UPI0035DE5193
MTGGKGRGRTWAPLRAESEEAGEIARFLRHLMDLHGVTVRALEAGVPYARSTISDNLTGKVPPKPFVEAVVRAVVLEPRKQAVDLRKALDLWQVAQTPPASVAVRSAPGPGTALALADKTSDRLYEVMDRNLELEKDRIGTQQLVLLLMRLVGSLQDQVAALSDAPTAAAELAAVTEQLLAAQKELDRARQARHEAELLASRAQQESVALQEELARLQAAAPSAEEAVPVAAQLPAELQEDFFLADVERALATAEGFLQEGAQLRERLDAELPNIGQSRPLEAVEDEERAVMRIVVLLACRTLGVVLVVAGAILNYALSTWYSRTAGGVGSLLWAPGVLLLVDPWDAYTDWWPALRARIHHEPEPPAWSIDLGDIFTWLLRISWAIGAAIGGVLILATFYWWPLWWLILLVPVTLGLVGYTVAGRSLPAVRVLIAITAQIASLSPGTALARAFHAEGLPRGHAQAP